MRLRTTNDLGDLVRDARRRAGMSQTELARQARTTGRAISALEDGKERVELGLALRVLGILGVSLDATVEAGTTPSRPGGSGLPGESRPRIDLEALIQAHLPVEPWRQPPQ